MVLFHVLLGWTSGVRGVFVDVRGHQGRVGSGLAAKEADAVVSISFARRIRRP